MDMPDPYAGYEVIKRTWIPQMHRRSIPNREIFSEEYNTPGSFRMGMETRDLEFLPQAEPASAVEETNPKKEGPKTEEEEEESFNNAIHVLQQLHVQPDEVKDFFQSGGYATLKRKYCGNY